MKLRVRLAFGFALFTSLTIAVAFTLTTAVFRRAQVRSLDEALLARADTEADEVMLLGGHKLNVEQAPKSSMTALSQLVKYGALYSLDGTPVAHTTTFGDSTPSLADLGYAPSVPLPYGGVDFVFGDQNLRCMVVAVLGDDDRPQSLLLLAVPRDDLDNDTWYLVRIMGLVYAGAVTLSILSGLWFGNHMTSDIEIIARVARRVSEGHLEARVPLSETYGAVETRSLAADLNEMIHRLAALIDSERRFVSHAAHELRSPISGLRGELELALRHPRSTEAYKEAIAAALDDTRRLQALAEDLLALARFGVSVPHMELCRVADLVAEAVRASTLRTDNHCRVDLEIPNDIHTRGQAGHLVRLLRNLLDNAVSHAPAGSTVRVYTERTGTQVGIAVEDNGSGVPSGLSEQIFEPFFRGDLERADSGAGLGLAIAREIARAHQGDLVLDSTVQPTRFIVWLPLTAA